MNSICSICGKKLTRSETVYRLHREYPDELACDSCIEHLKELRMYAKNGSALYKAARKELIGVLNCGNASDGAMDYCDKLIARLNDVYEEAATYRSHMKEPPPNTQEEKADEKPENSSGHSSDDERNGEKSPRAGAEPIIPGSSNDPASGGSPVPPPFPPSGPANSIICKKCGAENMADSVFCETCAAPLKEPKFCRYCGGRVSPVTGICESCSRDRNGSIYKPKTPGKEGSSNVSDVGKRIVSSVAGVGESISAKSWIPWLCAAIALIMGLMLTGKMISVPALSSFSESSSFSLFEVSELGDKASSIASFVNMDSQAEGLKVLSVMIILAVIGVLLTFVSTIVSAFRDGTKTASKLGMACKTLFLLLSICLITILIANGFLKEKTDGWIDTVMEPTGLFYVAFVLDVLIAFFVSNELQYQTALNLNKSGDFQRAKELFADLENYKDSHTMLERIKRESEL